MATYWSDMAHSRTCVYRLYDDIDTLLYVGMTKNPLGRFAKHVSKPWWPHVARRELEWFPNRTEALEAEKSAIHHEDPVHNASRPRMDCC